MKNVGYFLLLTLLPSICAASGSMSYVDLGLKLDGIPCSASPQLRSISTPTAIAVGYAVGTFQINFTRSAATAVNMKCYGSMDSNQTFAQFQACSVSSGVCESTNASWSKTVSSSTNWIWRVDFLGNSDVRCEIECVGGTSSDIINARLRIMDY